MNHRVALVGAAALGATGVAAGAFGAHVLRSFLTERGMLEAWQTGVHYHLLHAAALLGLAAWLRSEPNGVAARRASITAWCWIVGTALFSGSLYLIAVGAPRWVGPVTPAGGISLIAGWIFLAAAAWSAAP